MPVAEGGGIFVSYRRHDTRHLVGRLYDRFADCFGRAQVFMDVDTIEPGVDFAETITRAVAACQVFVAVIGPRWLTATDEHGRRRLDDPDDFVRLEIEAALARGVRVIPILADGAVMPGQHDLPDSLAGLARRHALFIRHESFGSDASHLVAKIGGVLDRDGPSVPSSPSPPAAPTGSEDVKFKSATDRDPPHTEYGPFPPKSKTEAGKLNRRPKDHIDPSST